MTETPAPLEGIILTPEDPGAMVSVSRPDPVAIFTTPQLVETILARVADLAMDFTPNLTTKAGRAEVASRARRVASTKVYLDDLGKAEVARLKDLPRQIDAGRKALRDGLDALKDRVRKPLDAWEAEDAAQQARLAGILALPRDLAHAPAANIEGQIAVLRLVSTDEATFGPYAEEARAAQAETLNTLQNLLEAAIKREEDARELARLRKEEADRQAEAERERLRQEGEERARKALEAQAAAPAPQAAPAPEPTGAQPPAPVNLAQADALRRGEPLTQAAADVEHRRAFNREALADINAAISAHAEANNLQMEGWEAETILRAIVLGKVRHISITY